MSHVHSTRPIVQSGLAEEVAGSISAGSISLPFCDCGRRQCVGSSEKSTPSRSFSSKSAMQVD